MRALQPGVDDPPCQRRVRRVGAKNDDVLNVRIIAATNQDLEETRESHLMRYFFPQELVYFLTQNGLKLLKISPFMNLSKEVSSDDWNVTIIAKGA